MQPRRTLNSSRRGGQPRGAAFLLSIYLSAMTLLILGGIALQRTAIESRAAQVSRDLAQAFWGTEAAFDQSVFALRQRQLPALDSLGCAYAMIPVDLVTGQGGSYMFCDTTNPEQYEVEMISFDQANTAPLIWTSAFVEREASQVTLTHAAVGTEGITVAHAAVGGTDTITRPLTVASLTTDGFGDYLVDLATPSSTSSLGGLQTWYMGGPSSQQYLIQTASGWFNNTGHLATSPTGTITVGDNSFVLGDILAGSTDAVTVSADSQHPETQIKTTTEGLVDVVPIQQPDNATDLAQALNLSGTTSSGDGKINLSSFAALTGSVDGSGNVTLAGAAYSLPPGTYTTDGDLTVVNGANLYTTGEEPVSLFVNGSLTIEQSIVTGKDAAVPSEFYPANLHIYVSPADPADAVSVSKGAILGAIVYAPQMPVRCKRKATCLGALFGRTVELGTNPSETDAYAADGRAVWVFYDNPVGNTPISPSPQNPAVQTLFYRVNKSFSEAASRTDLQQQRLYNWYLFILGQNPAWGARIEAVWLWFTFGGGTDPTLPAEDKKSGGGTTQTGSEKTAASDGSTFGGTSTTCNGFGTCTTVTDKCVVGGTCTKTTKTCTYGQGCTTTETTWGGPDTTNDSSDGDPK